VWFLDVLQGTVETMHENQIATYEQPICRQFEYSVAAIKQIRPLRQI
jgi:hypothetical protein